MQKITKEVNEKLDKIVETQQLMLADLCENLCKLKIPEREKTHCKNCKFNKIDWSVFCKYPDKYTGVTKNTYKSDRNFGGNCKFYQRKKLFGLF